MSTPAPTSPPAPAPAPAVSHVSDEVRIKLDLFEARKHLIKVHDEAMRQFCNLPDPVVKSLEAVSAAEARIRKLERALQRATQPGRRGRVLQDDDESGEDAGKEASSDEDDLLPGVSPFNVMQYVLPENGSEEIPWSSSSYEYLGTDDRGPADVIDREDRIAFAHKAFLEEFDTATRFAEEEHDPVDKVISALREVRKESVFADAQAILEFIEELKTTDDPEKLSVEKIAAYKADLEARETARQIRGRARLTRLSNGPIDELKKATVALMGRVFSAELQRAQLAAAKDKRTERPAATSSVSSSDKKPRGDRPPPPPPKPTQQGARPMQM